MTTLEEEIIIPLQRQMASQQAPTSTKLRLWPMLLIAGIGLLLGIATAALLFLKNDLGAAWKNGIASYQWLVMAEGDTVAIDEVGRFLKKMDGAENVTFISPDDVLEKAKLDGLLAADLSLLESNPFPAGWVVQWQEGAFGPTRLKEAAEEVKSFPGVVDIATDPLSLEKIHLYRTQWLRAKLALALLMVAFVICVSVAIGRFAFKPAPSWLRPKTFLLGALMGLMSGAAGAAILYLLW